MSAFNTSGGYELDHLVKHNIWSTLGNGLVVDLGGSHGDAMIALAMKYPSLKFVVQDLSRTIKSRPITPPNVTDQVEFLTHDFFEEQPIKNADVDFFRYWSDDYCLRILRNLIPALKPHSRIVINDACLPEPNTLSNGAERQIRYAGYIQLDWCLCLTVIGPWIWPCCKFKTHENESCKIGRLFS
jgi:hypothetical protein